MGWGKRSRSIQRGLMRLKYVGCDFRLATRSRYNSAAELIAARSSCLRSLTLSV